MLNIPEAGLFADAEQVARVFPCCPGSAWLTGYPSSCQSWSLTPGGCLGGIIGAAVMALHNDQGPLTC
jgi:hypothetical protein